MAHLSPRSRWFALAGIRIAGSLGAVLGVVLMARAHTTGPRLLGGALVLSALYMTASVSGALARSWRSEPGLAGTRGRGRRRR